MCGSCYDDILDSLYAEYTFSHEPAEVQEIRLRRHAFRIWDEQPTPIPVFEKAGDANTLENRLRYVLSPKILYRLWGNGVKKSVRDMNSGEATLGELTDAVGQDAATQYIKEHR